ncbi:extracellular superoxide dismutase [Cu-Zn]-like [Anguilla anguilla]|uniref:extracellular superoxide dismutase [Cu-Zn]-like n=1 Tax=Anguilla anguilla TaxID=7936 RepID=UPI0015B1C33B|nr:extracellular superoxide dismutase [Cu-Zn]-like [Anguilla anguilla]
MASSRISSTMSTAPPLGLPLLLPLLLVLTGLRGGVCEEYPRGCAGGGGRSRAWSWDDGPPEARQFSRKLYGACRMRPSTRLAQDQPKVYGHVLFRQDGPEAPVQVLLHLHGLPAASRQPLAVHVHQYGELSEGCDSTGDHYNPDCYSHPHHPGDFGNFVPRRGRIREQREAAGGEGGATLFGGTMLFGRAVVIHEGEDDLGRGGDEGSRLHGNAGRRLACCVIGLSSPKLWNKILQQQSTPSG